MPKLTNEDNEFALDPIQPEVAPAVVAPVATGPVLMVRAPGGAPGIRKANVPADEVANYLKAGWSVA